jgi:anti-anti-sigma factor
MLVSTRPAQEVTVSFTAPFNAAATVPSVEVFVDSDLNGTTLAQFHRQLVEAAGLLPERVVVDVTACSFISADALRVLLDAHTRLWRQGARLALRGCGAPVVRLLAAAGLRGVFDLEPALPGDHAPRMIEHAARSR